MKATLNISDVIMKQLKQESARQGKPMSDLVEQALRGLFRANRRSAELPALPSFDSGGAVADVANRDSLYERMGEP